ncbi:MAG: RelA/SpoT family protein [Bacteroidales bacterium]
MFNQEDKRNIDREFEILRLAAKKRCANEEEFEIVLKAYEFARVAHNGTRRRSGEPYILHPIAVAGIVVEEIGLGYKSIVAALIHDVVEDTEYSIEEVEHLFGAKIASLVDGLTKIKSAFDSQSSSQAENFKRILLTLNDDVRVILIKLADRLHNMRTLSYMPEHKRAKVLSETMYIFIPLAHRLGLYGIKTELENLWFYYTFEGRYQTIKGQIVKIEQENDPLMDNFIAPISNKLERAGYKFTISKRVKSPYSVWKKMEAKGLPFERIYDLFAVRIVFEPKEGQSERIQCWHIYSLITEMHFSKTERIRDWVSNPKINGYEALHCTVMGPQGNWVEIQIRSRRMDDIAERGIAAHWSYKNSDSHSEREMENWLDMVRDVLENPDLNALEFLDKFHHDFLSKEIYVFTPKGESKALAKGSTALDYAYSIHSEVGNKAIAAKANYKLVPLSYVLRNGDQIEVITTQQQKPQREWLDFVKTPRAKTLIMNALKSEVVNHLKVGQEKLDEKLLSLGITPQVRVYRKLAKAYNLNNRQELFSKIGADLLDIANLAEMVKHSSPKKKIKFWNLQLIGLGGREESSTDDDDDDTGSGEDELSEQPNITFAKEAAVIKKGKDFLLQEDVVQKRLSYEIAPCCKPIPGDGVIGFIDDQGGVVVHKNSCPEAIQLASMHGNTIVKVKWTKHLLSSFLARISLRGIDRIGILNDLSQFITLVLNVNIRKIFIETHDGIFEGFIDLYVHSTEDLYKIIKQMEEVEGVEEVVRSELIDA